MWLLMHLMFSSLLVASPSPFMGVIFLVFSSVTLAASSGVLLSSWLFFSVIMVYVGGVLILFVYMSSLISEHKVLEISVPWGLVTVVLLSLLAMSQLFLSRATLSFNFNLSQGLAPSSQGMTMFSVVYLIITLVVVLSLLGKDGGPMKAAG